MTIPFSAKKEFSKEEVKQNDIFSVYAVFDNRANMHLAPFLSQNDAVAVRNFGDSVQNVQSPLNKHPEDYSLFKLGTFDCVSGFFTNLERGVKLIDASSCLKG